MEGNEEKTALQELHDHLVSAWSSPGDLWRPDLIIEKVEQMITVEKEQKESQTGMEGNEIEKEAEELVAYEYEIDYPEECIWIKGFKAGANWQKERENAELTRTNAQLDEMVTKYNELSKKYADLYSKYYGK